MASQVRLSHCNMGSGLRGDQVWELGIEHYPAIIRSASSRKITDIGSGLNPTTYTWNCEEKGLRCMVKSRRSVKIRVTGRSSSESSQVILAQIRLWGRQELAPQAWIPGCHVLILWYFRTANIVGTLHYHLLEQLCIIIVLYLKNIAFVGHWASQCAKYG